MVPAGPHAQGLVQALTKMCMEQEAPQRGNSRGVLGVAKLTKAVGATIGNLLIQGLRPTPRAVYQSRKRGAFTGETVGHAQFMSAKKALLSLGMIGKAPKVAYRIRNGGGKTFQRDAARIRPTAALLDLATAHGIGPKNIKSAFRQDHPKAPLEVGYGSIVEVREVRSFWSKRAGIKAPRMPHMEALPELMGVFEEVLEVNAEAERHTFDGCRPPSWSRVFAKDNRFRGAGMPRVVATRPCPRTSGRPSVSTGSL